MDVLATFCSCLLGHNMHIVKKFFLIFQHSHKCPCAQGLECKVTKELTIPAIPGITDSITLSLRQCMPPDENVEIEKVEMTEN